MGKMLKGFGFPAIMNFLRNGRHREETIAKTKEAEIVLSPTNEKAKALHPKTQVGKVIAIKPLGDKAVLYTLEARRFAYFRAGQYVSVILHDEKAILARPISIVSSPEEALEGKLSLAIARNDKGYFAALAPKVLTLGSEVTISGPSGEFYYSPLRDESHVIACAGGIGITPILSMAKAITEGSEDFKLTILYGVKSQKEAVFAEELAKITAKCAKIKVRILYEDKGELISKKAILEEAGDAPYSLYVCGPQGMYLALDKIANELSLDPKHYRKEIFGSLKNTASYPGYPGSSSPAYKATIHMVDKTFELTVPYDEPILYALEKQGIATPNRCRGGICGYCRGKVIQGEVFIPEINDGRREEDKQKGYAHLCMTYPLSDVEIEIPAP